MNHQKSGSFLAVVLSLLLVATFVHATTLPTTVTPQNLVLRDAYGNIVVTSLTVALINNTDGYVQLARALTESGTVFPATPAVGYLYYRTDLQALYIYTGATWVTAMSATLPPGTISYSDLSDKPDLTVFLLQNGTRSLTTDWNVGSHGIYGLTFLNATAVCGNLFYANNQLVIDNGRNGYFVNVNATWLNSTSIAGTGQLWWNGQNRTDTLAYPFAPYSYEVGVSGSNYYMKNGSTGQVDFWSTNASAVFNNAAGNTSDGSIFVKNSGTIYNITNAIILKNNVSWYSDGAHLRLQNNATVSDTTANIFYDNGLDVANITIDGFEIDGNMLSDNLDIIGTAHCGIGIYARSQGQHITISNNWIHDNRVYGVNIRAGSNKISFDNHIFHNRIEDNGYDGADFFLYDSTSQFYGSSMTNNYVTGMGDIGLGVGLVTGAVGDHMDIDISHNIIEEMDGLYGSVAPAAWIGIRLEDANFSSVSNNIIRGVCMGISDIVSGEGFNTYTNNEIYLKNPNQSSTIKGINILTNNNTITGNLIVSPPSSTWDGLYINANSSIVENNIFLNLSASTGTSTAIYDDSGSYYNRFFKNDVGTCTYKFKRYGTNNVWRDNIGYMTENWVSGANTTATTIVISHGLAGTPQYVFASFNFTGWTSWTWTATSTQITITVTGTLPASYTAYTYTKYDP